MKHIVIGTAGHIDHGKSCLTTALTEDSASRRHIDRLKEERQRGITIELGFAEFVLPNGQIASIVDVPGHEKLIKHMLMGAAGMDMVLSIRIPAGVSGAVSPAALLHKSAMANSC